MTRSLPAPASTPPTPQTQIITPETTHSLFGVGVVWQDDEIRRIAWEMAKEHWLAGQRSENTSRAYEIAHRQFFEWSGREPWEIGSALAQQWHNHLKAQGLADTTINAKLAAMSAFYKFILQDYLVAAPDGRDLSLWAGHANPFSAVKKSKVSPYGRATFPTTAEVQRILEQINTDCLRGKRDFALIYTYMTTCRRFSEVINLTWGDISPGENGNYVIRYVAKGGKVERSELHQWAYQAIVEYLKADGRWETMVDEDYIFVSLDPERAQRLHPDLPVNPNRPISNRTANNILRKHARRAGVDEKVAHLHGLRHAGLRQELQRQRASGSVDLLALMQISKHSGLDTLRIYTEAIGSDPEDIGLDERARELMPSGKRRRRRKEPPGEQERLFE